MNIPSRRQLGVSLGCALLIVGIQVGAAPGDTTLVTKSNGGGPSNGQTLFADISADGRFVVFESNANNLVSDDTNGVTDIFLYDRTTDLIKRVSINSAGEQGNNDSAVPNISANGRFIAFQSLASNLVPSDTNTTTDVFVFDRQTSKIERISINDSAEQGNDFSTSPSIDGNGRYIAFSSAASNLVTGDNNEKQDVFVHDRQTGKNKIVSVSSSGEQGNGGVTEEPKLSDNGQKVIFSSSSTNLISNPDIGFADNVFLRNRPSSQTRRININSQGDVALGFTFNHEISADGRFVVFESDANNLVQNDTNDTSDIFLHSLETGVTERVSVNSAGAEGDGASFNPRVNGDGRYVTFESLASNLAPGNASADERKIFVHDRNTEQTKIVNLNITGVAGEAGNTFNSAISASGRFLVIANDPLPLDFSNPIDLYIQERNVSGSGGNTVTASSQSQETRQNTPLPITLEGHPDTATLTFVVIDGPDHGILAGTAPKLTYIPTAGFVGSDSFRFTASNGGSVSAPGSVDIDVHQSLAKFNLSILLDGKDTSNPGPVLSDTGGPITWTYSVSNDGGSSASNVLIYGKQKQPAAANHWRILCSIGEIPAGTRRGCEVSDTVVAGAYKALVTTRGLDNNGNMVKDGKAAYYSGGISNSTPSLSLHTLTNGVLHDNTTSGPELSPGDQVTFTHEVTNDGPVTLRKIRLFSKQMTPKPNNWNKVCEIKILTPGNTSACTEIDTVSAGGVTHRTSAQSFYRKEKIRTSSLYFYIGR